MTEEEREATHKADVELLTQQMRQWLSLFVTGSPDSMLDQARRAIERVCPPDVEVTVQVDAKNPSALQISVKPCVKFIELSCVISTSPVED